MKRCSACGKELSDRRKVGRSETCGQCGADLHVCKNCEYWDPGAHNQCREKITEFIPDREQANFCTFFLFKNGEPGTNQPELQAKAKLAALFAPKK